MITAKFSHPENGTNFDKKYLKVNKLYGVSNIVIHGNDIYIYLFDYPEIKFPERLFNSMLFDFYENNKKIDINIYKNSQYDPYA